MFCYTSVDETKALGWGRRSADHLPASLAPFAKRGKKLEAASGQLVRKSKIGPGPGRAQECRRGDRLVPEGLQSAGRTQTFVRSQSEVAEHLTEDFKFTCVAVGAERAKCQVQLEGTMMVVGKLETWKGTGNQPGVSGTVSG